MLWLSCISLCINEINHLFNSIDHKGFLYTLNTGQNFYFVASLFRSGVFWGMEVCCFSFLLWFITGYKYTSLCYTIWSPFLGILNIITWTSWTQESVSPVPCKFWRLYGGVNVDLWEGLRHTQVYCTQGPCPCSRPLLTCTSAEDTQTQFLLSLCGVSGFWWTQGFVWALQVSLADIGFDSKRDFAPPTILLGLRLCPGTWGIFFWWNPTFSC